MFTQVCYAISQLAAGFKDGDAASPLSPYFKDIVQALLETVRRSSPHRASSHPPAVCSSPKVAQHPSMSPCYTISTMQAARQTESTRLQTQAFEAINEVQHLPDMCRSESQLCVARDDGR